MTAIQWTDVTDNIIVAADGGWWCRKISPGCAHCYAEKLNDSTYFKGNHLPYSGEAPVLKLRGDVIAKWARMRTAKKHFVMSMSDVFGEWVPPSWIFQFLDGMAAAPLQTFQVLTKRADVMRREVMAWLAARGLDRVPSHIWLGVTTEDQERANQRILELLQIPAVRFLSVEPMLGPVDLTQIRHGNDPDLPMFVDWVIVGGESGPKARPCNVAWIESIVEQCRAAGVPVFVKQLGAKPRVQLPEREIGDIESHPMMRWPADASWSEYDGFAHPLLDSRKGGDPEEWPAHLRIRQFPEVSA